MKRTICFLLCLVLCMTAGLLPARAEGEGVTYTKVEEVPATCTTDGMKEHYLGSDGLLYVKAEGMTAVDPDDLKIPALGHNWEPTVYTWSDDYSECVASRCCRNEAEPHIEEEFGFVQPEITRYPTETEKGETTYTAYFDSEWAETQVKTVANLTDVFYPIELIYNSSMGRVICGVESAVKGTTVKFSVECDENAWVSSVSVETENGKIPYTDLSNNLYQFTAPGGPVRVTVVFHSGASDFEDIDRSAYYYDAVDWAVRNQITSGINDTQFGPDRSCTRAEAVSFIWRAKGCPRPANMVNPFDDMHTDSYYALAVMWAVEEGITSGIGDRRFGPNETCTRAQIVSFLYRANGSPSIQLELPFTDVFEGDFYADAVKWAVSTGITAGITPTTFRPGQDCSRAQIVSFLMREDSMY